MRIGGDGDGGYLVPSDLEGVVALFSPGVSTIANFELEFAQRDVPCFLADRTVDYPPLAHRNFHFLKRHLGRANTDETITLDQWVSRNCARTGDLILQMDIEGAEYDVIDSAPAGLLERFRIIVLEAHGLNRLWRASGYLRIARMFQRLLTTHAVVHLHANNCLPPRQRLGLSIHPVIEFTFLRRDRATEAAPILSLPHPLDRSNVRGFPEWPLDPNWYLHSAEMP